MEAGPNGCPPTVQPHIEPLRIVFGGLAHDPEADRRVHLLAPGETFDFGRNPGPGQLGADDPTLSRTHGFISNYRDHWEATSTGSYVGFVVYDTESTDVIEIPAGSGPFTVPYRTALIVIPAGRRYVLSVESPHEPGYSYRPATSLNDFHRHDQILAEADLVDRRGRPLPWFRALIALCEPRLRSPSGSVEVRSESDLAQRLDISVEEVEAALDDARNRLGFGVRGELTHHAMMNMAVHEGIVRSEHIDLLAPTPF